MIAHNNRGFNAVLEATLCRSCLVLFAASRKDRIGLANSGYSIFLLSRRRVGRCRSVSSKGRQYVK
jgi:hypothetical protein